MCLAFLYCECCYNVIVGIFGTLAVGILFDTVFCVVGTGIVRFVNVFIVCLLVL